MKLNTPFLHVMPSLPPEKFAALKADIAINGVIKPVVIDEDNNIIDGHHRYRACQDLGIECVTVSCLGIGDDPSKRLRIISLNLSEREISPADRKRLSAEQRSCALKMLEEGKSTRAIARLIGRGESTIRDWRNENDAPRARSAQDMQTVAIKQECAPKKTEIEPTSRTTQDPAKAKAKALTLAANGMRLYDIAHVVQCDPKTVKKWIDDPESPTRQGVPGRHAFSDDEVTRLFNEGKSVVEIAATLGAMDGTISAYLKRLGLSKAGKRLQNPLAEHISRISNQADALEVGAGTLVAAAMTSSEDQIKSLLFELGRLSRAAVNLKHRLNKEAGKE